MSERGLTNQWEPWQRLIDSIGPYYCKQLFAARDPAIGELRDLDEEQLEAIAALGRAVARSLDEEGARLTVKLTEDRERDSRLAADLQREAELLLRRERWALAPRRRRQARAEAAEQVDRAEDHRRRAARAHERLRELGNSGRHLYPWFERHQDVLARGIAAELTSTRRKARSTTSSARPGSRRSPPPASPPTGRSISADSNGSSSRTARPDSGCCSRWEPSCMAASRGSRSASCSPSSMAKTWTGCSRRSRCSSGDGARLTGRRTISGYAPPNLSSRNLRRVDRPAER